MQDIIRPEDWKVVTKLMYFVFFPCLVVSALGSSVTASTLLSWWPLPVSTMLNVVLGMLLGAAVFPFVGMPMDLRPHFISCAGVGAIPIILACSPEKHMYFSKCRGSSFVKAVHWWCIVTDTACLASSKRHITVFPSVPAKKQTSEQEVCSLCTSEHALRAVCKFRPSNEPA